jgi:hypothetical protein
MTKRPFTRRAIAKILLAAPAALAAGPLACQSAQGPRSANSRLTAAERKRQEDLAQSVSRLKKSVARLGQMEIPIGSEPAIFFTPLVGKK